MITAITAAISTPPSAHSARCAGSGVASSTNGAGRKLSGSAAAHATAVQPIQRAAPVTWRRSSSHCALPIAPSPTTATTGASASGRGASISAITLAHTALAAAPVNSANRSRATRNGSARAWPVPSAKPSTNPAAASAASSAPGASCARVTAMPASVGAR